MNDHLTLSPDQPDIINFQGPNTRLKIKIIGVPKLIYNCILYSPWSKDFLSEPVVYYYCMIFIRLLVIAWL